MKALALLAAASLMCIACTEKPPETLSGGDRSAVPVTVASRAAATSTPSIFGTKYSVAVQTRIDEAAARGDCAALQAEFDQAARNDGSTRSRIGSGTADLMAYIDAKLRGAGCYR